MQSDAIQRQVVRQQKAILLHFPSGILGFQDIKDYIILDDEAGSPLKWLQAVDEPEVSFVMTEPSLFVSDYQVEIADQDGEELQVEDPDHLAVFVLITLPLDDKSLMTANLQGPIVINTKNYYAKQVVLHNSPYHTRHPIRVVPQ